MDLNEKGLTEIQKEACGYYQKGNDLCTEKQYEKSLDCFNKAIAIDGKNAGYHAGKGKALRLLLRHHEALQCYNDAIAFDDGRDDYFSNKARLSHKVSKNNRKRDMESIRKKLEGVKDTRNGNY
ncbi:MAG: tetratricopeptide repeat protein, partial [Spirochaetales bacterium]